MFKELKQDKGAVLTMVASIVVVLISLISSFSLITSITLDHQQMEYQHDMLQEDMLLRSETRRTHLAHEFNVNRPLPPRKVELTISNRLTTYMIKSTVSTVYITNYLGYTTAEAKAVRSLIEGKRARSFVNARLLPIKRYSERIMSRESLAQYQYFTDIETSENCDGNQEAQAVKFWGPDVFYGRIHSNSDIWIQQAGGGNNNGWPTFFDLVTTSGIFRKYPSGERLEDSGAPMDDIFRGSPEPGWQENVPYINFDPVASDIYNNGLRPFEDPNIDIVSVKIDGAGFTSMKGEIQLVEIRPFTVYSWYPMNESQANAKALAGQNWFEESDSLWVNYVPIYDTIWSQGPTGVVSDASVWVPCELWISGSIRGKQTWGCADTIYIVGDITYENTTIGQEPDQEGNENLTDYFGLVSEEKIIMRYKHRDPETNAIISVNCNHLYLYGAYAAIGDGDEAIHGGLNCHYEGIFTFQYQHPHGSTPSFWALSPYTLQETLYSYVDLHKFIYPPSAWVPPNLEGFLIHGNLPVPPNGMCGFPYEDPGYIFSYPNNGPGYAIPYGTDYPWYNPVWPESSNDIINCTERGNLYIFGAIAQRRRGFIHRSGTDPYNHPDPWEWDISAFHYDGTHPSMGYNKQYHYDTRFLVIQPPDYPEIYRGFGQNLMASFNEDTWYFKVPPEN